MVISRPSGINCRIRSSVDLPVAKPNHPWTNGQVERMKRTIKDATVKRYHYDSHSPLRSYPADFMNAYLRSPLEDAARSHSLRIHVQNLDIRAISIHPKSDPPDAGTERLATSNHRYACTDFRNRKKINILKAL